MAIEVNRRSFMEVTIEAITSALLAPRILGAASFLEGKFGKLVSRRRYAAIEKLIKTTKVSNGSENPEDYYDLQCRSPQEFEKLRVELGEHEMCFCSDYSTSEAVYRELTDDSVHSNYFPETNDFRTSAQYATSRFQEDGFQIVRTKSYITGVHLPEFPVAMFVRKIKKV